MKYSGVLSSNHNHLQLLIVWHSTNLMNWTAGLNDRNRTEQNRAGKTVTSTHHGTNHTMHFDAMRMRMRYDAWHQINTSVIKFNRNKMQIVSYSVIQCHTVSYSVIQCHTVSHCTIAGIKISPTTFRNSSLLLVYHVHLQSNGSVQTG